MSKMIETTAYNGSRMLLAVDKIISLTERIPEGAKGGPVTEVQVVFDPDGWLIRDSLCSLRNKYDEA